MNETRSPGTISQADVEHVASLASLALTPEELTRFGKDLGSILGYVAELQALDTSGIEPLTHVYQLYADPATGPEKSELRTDTPRPSLPRESVMAAAPATDGTFFKVPKVIER